MSSFGRAGQIVDVDLSEPAMVRLLTRHTDDLAKRAAMVTRDRARRAAPKKTGEGAASIDVEKIEFGKTTTYEVTIGEQYMVYQDQGTGPIHAKRGGVLTFVVGGRRVFVKHTKGVPAQHFMRRAANMLTDRDFF